MCSSAPIPENPAPCMSSLGRNPNPAKTTPLPEDHDIYKLHVYPFETPKGLHQEPSNSTDSLLLSSGPRSG